MASTAGINSLATSMEPAEKNATCLSRILFSWVDPLLRRGYASPLQMEHIWPLQPRESAVELRARFFAHTDSAADDGAIDADGDGATMDDVVSCGQFVQNVFRAEANTLLRSAAFSGVHMLSQCATPMLLKVLVESIYHGASSICARRTTSGCGDQYGSSRTK